MALTEEQTKRRIEDVLHERAGVQRRGLKDRVEACNAELKRLGYEDPDAPKERKAPETFKSKADAKGRVSA